MYYLFYINQCMAMEIMNKITEITHGEVTVGAGSLYTYYQSLKKNVISN